MLGDLVTSVFQFAKARDLLLQAVAIDQSFDEAYSEMAKAYRGLDQTEQAIGALRHAVALNSAKAEYHYVLARLYARTDHAQEAKDELATYAKCKEHER